MMMSLSAGRPVFAILSTLVEERAGVHYAPDDQDLFLERVTERARDEGFDSLLDYYYFLRYDPAGTAELDRLVEHLVVHETFFFREIEPLRRVVSHFILPLVRAGKKPRIWSAACATGEEPLTVAMLLAEENVLSGTEILASDISERALTRARAGRFSKRSLRGGMDAQLAQRWIREDADKLRVAPELSAAITWKRVNLCDRSETEALGEFDIILCRNVLIYFRDETVVRVIQGLSSQLRVGGALLVGVSESLLRFGTALACEELDRVFLYRKVP
jgi:chemotaxis protein methyltransferase CheR